MKESTPLFNNGLRSNSSETIESSTSTFVVDINQGNNDGGDDLKQYGALDDSCNCAQQIGEDDQVPVIRGIADMFLSCFSFAIMHLTMKFLIKDNYPVSQLLLFRSVTTAVGCSIYAYYAKIPGGPFGPPEDRFWLNFRGTLGAISIVTFFLSLENLTLGDTLALSFISPVIMPILSSVWLGEDYTSVDALATFIAMTGVTFISKPEFLFGTDDPNGGSSGLGIFYAVIAASTGALSNISIRKISKKSTSIHIVNYMMLWTLPVCLGMIYNEPAAFKFELGYFQAGQFLIVAFFSFIGQYWLGRSLLTTPARFVSPIMFTQVFYAYINQYVFWGIMPTSSSTVGVALVACSLILLHYKI